MDFGCLDVLNYLHEQEKKKKEKTNQPQGELNLYVFSSFLSFEVLVVIKIVKMVVVLFFSSEIGADVSYSSSLSYVHRSRSFFSHLMHIYVLLFFSCCHGRFLSCHM